MRVEDHDVDDLLAAYLDGVRRDIAEAEAARAALAEILVSENMSPSTEEWV